MQAKPMYKVVEREHRFFVFGYVGAGKYMQMSDGLASREAANVEIRRYAGSTASAKAELRGWDFKRNRD